MTKRERTKRANDAKAELKNIEGHLAKLTAKEKTEGLDDWDRIGKREMETRRVELLVGLAY